jgi:hypothetical protein
MSITAPITVGNVSFGNAKPGFFGDSGVGSHIEPLVARPMVTHSGVRTEGFGSFEEAVGVGRNEKFGLADGAVGVFQEQDGTHSLGRLVGGEAGLVDKLDGSKVSIPAPYRPNYFNHQTPFIQLTDAGKGVPQLKAIVHGKLMIDARSAPVREAGTHLLTQGWTGQSKIPFLLRMLH